MGGEIFAKTAKTPPLQPDVCGDADATNLALGISPGDYMVGQGGAHEGEDGRVIACRPPMRPHALCSDVACRVAHGRLPIQISLHPPPLSPHQLYTNSRPTPYLGRFMFGVRLKAKPEHEAAQVGSW